MPAPLDLPFYSHGTMDPLDKSRMHPDYWRPSSGDVTITEISLVRIGPETIAKVAQRTGRTEEAVRAYLAGPEQDSVLRDAFLFFGIGPMGKR